MPDHSPVRIGVSACLLGRDCRYDGKHKRDSLLCDTLGQRFQCVPICPEVELGLPTPRPAMQLQRRAGEIRLVVPEQEKDLTEAMLAYARRRVAALAEEGVCGFVLKSKSPSCGIWDVPVYEDAAAASQSGRGLFAETLMTRLPNLPVEDQRRLQDARLRENWIARVFAYARNSAP
ncbi:MAG: DUF523 domain-containing protein [Candidatus Nealsonbacteria bacterium]|nr:DUF523 domain-containing protein [Candidatus Nealsonbacteria bacterium]